MDPIYIPTERDFKKWIRDILDDFFRDKQIAGNPEALPPDDMFLNRKQVAGRLGISLVTLHAWMNSGLPCHKKGRRVLFIYSEVIEYVKAHKRRNLDPVVNSCHVHPPQVRGDNVGA